MAVVNTGTDLTDTLTLTPFSIGPRIVLGNFQIPVGSTSAGAVLSSLTPAGGSLLNTDPELARWTPIVGRIQCNTGEVPYVFVKIGSIRWTVYDGIVVSPFFADHTTVVNLGADMYDISVLPNGGWWRSSIDIHFVSGVEAI